MFNTILSKRDFRQQLTIRVGLLILCTTVVFALVTAFTTSRQVKSSLIDRGQSLASTLAQSSVLSLLYRSPSNADMALNSILADQEVVRAEIIDPEKNILVTRSKGPEHLRNREIRDIDFQKIGLSWETDDFLGFLIPVQAGGNPASPFEMNDVPAQQLGYVHVLVTKNSLNHLITSVIANTIFIALLSAVLLAFIVKAIAKTLSQPLEALSVLMDDAGKGQLGIRASPEGPRDIHNMALAFNRMMTELEDREKALQRSRDDALRSGMLKAQFAATVSHEVRTPLNGIVGMLDLMKQQPLPDQQRANLDVAWRSTQSLMALLNDILDFSKMEAGKLELNRRDFDLHKLIEDVIDLFGKQAHQKGVYVGYSISPSVADRINGDALRLRQVLTNLVSNAVKFTESGEIALRVSTVENKDKTLLQFKVSDTGIGMTSDEAAYVFESFNQVHRAATRNYGGTGLGLAISKQLVKLMGGQIGVTSERGRGSSFWFTIEFEPGSAVELDDEHPLLFDTRVLIVDDSQITLDFITECLSRRGMRCESCRRGDDAWEILAAAAASSDPFTVVITDAGAIDDRGEYLVDRIVSEMGSRAPKVLRLDLYALPYQTSLTKGNMRIGRPLTKARLFDAVQMVLEAQTHTIPLSELGRTLPSAAAIPRYRALVVEDNKTSQVVVTGMLEIVGCSSKVVSTAVEAAESVKREKWDLILISCELPHMEAAEATRQIREYEALAGERTSIIAMASSKNDRDDQGCLAFGMDDLIQKPLTLEAIRNVIGRLSAKLSPAPLNQPSLFPELDRNPAGVPVLSIPKIETLRNDIGDHLNEVVGAFLIDTPSNIDEIELALVKGDLPTARRFAHTIKGSSSNLGGLLLAEVAGKCENAIAAGRHDEIGPTLTQMRAVFATLRDALANFVNGEVKGLPSVIDPTATILVVDDDRSSRIMLKRLLQNHGYGVYEATNGAEAISLLDKVTPDVILMDAFMPVMDGFEACEEMQKLPASRLSPVIIMTSVEDESSVERAFAAGATDYMLKSSITTVLLQRIKRTVATNIVIREAHTSVGVDALTQLPNRPTFLENLAQSLPQTQPRVSAVLYVDIDKFSVVNDDIGHLAADKVLVEVGRRLVRFAMSRGLAARVGGDQFALLVSALDDHASVDAVAQSVASAIAQPFDIDGQSLFITASVGVAVYPTDGRDAALLLRRANNANIRAKQSGQTYAFYEASTDPKASDIVKAEGELRSALDRNEFAVLYQPIVEVLSAQITGVEALLRWRRSPNELCLPVEFLGAAIESGMIHQLGIWMMEEACRQVQAWRTNGWPDMTLTVNVSSEELLHPEFLSSLDGVLAGSRLPYSSLIIDLPENFLTDYPKQAGDITKAIDSKGIEISVDDFGTGFTALSYLAKYPITTVKIDRAFVRDVPRSAADAALLKETIVQIREHGMRVVAEGVETLDQHLFLKQHSCDLMQGYITGVPAEPDVIYAMLTRQRAVSPTSGREI